MARISDWPVAATENAEPDTRCVLVKSEFGAKELILVGTGEQSLNEKGFKE